MRRGGSAKAKAKRTAKRRSLVNFVQLTDPQIADEMSPARVDFADPAGGELKSSWRPQEALGLQVFDSVVRNVNANRRSRVKQGNGKRAKPGFAITTGDLADNQQLNETRWFKTVLDGGRSTRSPASRSRPSAATSPPETLARINADVAARNYTGVADYDDYRDAPADRFAGFYDPDEAAPTAGPYAAFPRYPGLLEAAQRPFRPPAWTCPGTSRAATTTASSRATRPPATDLFRAIAVGCLKVFPNAAFDPKRFEGPRADELFAAFGDPGFIQQLIAGGKTVAPDPDRRVISKREYRSIVGNTKTHGFGYTPKSQLQQVRRHRQLLRVHAQEGLPLHLARHRRRGRRPERQHRRPAVPLAQGELRSAKRKKPARGRLRPPHARDDEQHARPTSARASATRPTSPAATATRASRPRCTAASPARTRSARCSPPTRT